VRHCSFEQGFKWREYTWHPLFLRRHNNRAFREQVRRALLDSLPSHREIVRIDLDTYAVPPQAGCSDGGCSSSHERIKNRVADKTKHPYEPLRELKRVRCWMLFRRSPTQSIPNLLEPFLMFVGGYDT